VISVDCAFKDVATSDYVAILVIGVKGRKRYILNIVNRHLDAAATEAEIRRQHELYYPSAILVEDKANGPAVIQRLQVNVSGVVEINPEGGKIARSLLRLLRGRPGIGMLTEMLLGLDLSSNRSLRFQMVRTTIWQMLCHKLRAGYCRRPDTMERYTTP
jgi:Terminase RNaseH-like domain